MDDLGVPFIFGNTHIFFSLILSLQTSRSMWEHSKEYNAESMGKNVFPEML